MKATFTFFILMLCVFSASKGQNVGIEWTRIIGAHFYSICTDADGNTYSTGYFDGTVDFDPGPGIHVLNSDHDVFVLKLDQNGNFLWAIDFGAANNEDGNSINLDASGNIYVVGHFKGTVDFDPGIGTYNLISTGENDAFVLKLDPNGSFIWAKSFGGTLEVDASGLVIDNAGNCVISGSFKGIVDLDPGTGTYSLTNTSASYNSFICKLDNQGNFLWAKSLGGAYLYNDLDQEITIDNAGNILLTGRFWSTVDFDPGTGVYELNAGSFTDVFVLKLQSNGDFIWAKSIGSWDDWESGISIATDSDNNVFFGGSFTNPIDLDPGPGVFMISAQHPNDQFIEKLDSDGNFIWGFELGSKSIYSLATDKNGNIYYFGTFEDSVDFDPGPGVHELYSNVVEVFALKLNNSGNFIWVLPLLELSNYVEICSIDSVSDIYISGVSFISKISQNSSSVNENSFTDFEIFPNPTNGTVTVNIPLRTFSKLTVTNLFGQEILSQDIYTDQITLNLTGLSPGTYFINLQGNSDYSVKKVMIR